MSNECFTLCVCESLSHVQLFVTPWTVARKAPLSMGILQARIVERVAMPSSRDLPDSGMEPASLTLAGRFFTTGKPMVCLTWAHLGN